MKKTLLATSAIICLLLSSSWTITDAWSGRQQLSWKKHSFDSKNLWASSHESDSRTNSVEQSTRRNVLGSLLWTTTAWVVQQQPAQAVLAEENKIFTGKPITVDFAKERFKLAQKDLQYLLDHYDEIAQGGGDNVRRYLGYVGTTSGLFGIQKVLKVLQEEADDFVSFTDDMNEFNSYLAGAEGAAYSAIFSVTSTSTIKPEKYFNDAKINVKKMKYYMDSMATELKL
jgi:hypothetical protein